MVVSEDGDDDGDGVPLLPRLYSGAIDCVRASVLIVPSEYTGTALIAILDDVFIFEC